MLLVLQEALVVVLNLVVAVLSISQALGVFSQGSAAGGGAGGRGGPFLSRSKGPNKH